MKTIHCLTDKKNSQKYVKKLNCRRVHIRCLLVRVLDKVRCFRGIYTVLNLHHVYFHYHQVLKRSVSIHFCLLTLCCCKIECEVAVLHAPKFLCPENISPQTGRIAFKFHSQRYKAHAKRSRTIPHFCCALLVSNGLFDICSCQTQ